MSHYGGQNKSLHCRVLIRYLKKCVSDYVCHVCSPVVCRDVEGDSVGEYTLCCDLCGPLGLPCVTLCFPRVFPSRLYVEGETACRRERAHRQPDAVRAAAAAAVRRPTTQPRLGTVALRQPGTHISAPVAQLVERWHYDPTGSENPTVAICSRLRWPAAGGSGRTEGELTSVSGADRVQLCLFVWFGCG